MKLMWIKSPSITLIFFLILATFPIYSANADTIEDLTKSKSYLYEGCIFAVSDITGNGKKEVIAQAKDERNLSILRWNGLWFRKIGEIEIPTGNVNDVAVGDVDNDGDEEIAIITDRAIYIIKKENVLKAPPTPYEDELLIYNENMMGNYSWLKIAYPHVTKESIHRPEEKGVNIRIADINNDNKNEIIYTKMIGTAHEFNYIYLGIIEWNGENFVNVKNIIFDGSGNQGFEIFDIDKDNLNELLIAKYGDVEIYRYDSEIDDLIQEGWFELHLNTGDQRITVFEEENKYILAYVILYITSGKSENIGKINFVQLNPESIPKDESDFIYPETFKGKDINEIIPKMSKIQIDTKSFTQLGLPIKLPTKLDNRGREYINLNKLFAQDIDGDNKIEIIANLPIGAYIYGLKVNVALIVAIIAGAILIIALAVFLFIRRRKKKAT